MNWKPEIVADKPRPLAHDEVRYAQKKRTCPVCSRKYAASGYRTFCLDCRVWISDREPPEWLVV